MKQLTTASSGSSGRASPPRTAGTPPRADGFTLIEVLIALAIIAIALAAALRAVGSLADNATALHERLLAGWSADNQLAQLQLAHEWPDIGTSSFDCPQGNLALVCTQTVSGTVNPIFRRVEVVVKNPARGQVSLADLVTVVANETKRPL